MDKSLDELIAQRQKNWKNTGKGVRQHPKMFHKNAAVMIRRTKAQAAVKDARDLLINSRRNLDARQVIKKTIVQKTGDLRAIIPVKKNKADLRGKLPRRTLMQTVVLPQKVNAAVVHRPKKPLRPLLQYDVDVIDEPNKDKSVQMKGKSLVITRMRDNPADTRVQPTGIPRSMMRGSPDHESTPIQKPILRPRQTPLAARHNLTTRPLSQVDRQAMLAARQSAKNGRVPVTQVSGRARIAPSRQQSSAGSLQLTSQQLSAPPYKGTVSAYPTSHMEFEPLRREEPLYSREFNIHRRDYQMSYRGLLPQYDQEGWQTQDRNCAMDSYEDRLLSSRSSAYMDKLAETSQRYKSPPRSTTATAPSDGYLLKVSNLSEQVTEEDVVELFSDIGSLRRAKLLRTGYAEVVFVNRTDALQAYEKYHRRELDGIPMSIQLVDKALPRESGAPRTTSLYADNIMGHRKPMTAVVTSAKYSRSRF